MSFVKNKSIKQIFQMLIIITVLSIISLSIIPLLIDKKEREQEFVENLDSIVKTQRLFIDNWLDERANDVRTLATLPSSKALDFEKMREVFTTFATSNPNFSAIVFVDKDGFAKMDTNTLKELNIDLSDRQYFIEAKQGKEHVSDVITGRNTGASVVTFSSPIFNDDGKFLGVILGPVLLDTLDQMMNQLEIGKTGETYLADKNGHILTKTRNSVEDDNYPLQIPTNLLKNALEDKPLEIRSFHDYRGIDVIGTYAWTNNHNWLIVGKVDKNEVLQPFFRTTITMVVISLFVLILSYLFITKVHKAIQQSINYVLEGAKAITKGDYSNQTNKIVSKEGPTELQELCVVHNEMASTLERNIQIIEENVTQLKKTEKELIQLTNSLKQSNQDLKQFAYVASHDLQEPLRMVTSYLQLIEKRYKDHLDEDANDFIHYAVDGAKRMQKLINDLLAYSRVNTKGKEFSLVDCNQVIKKALYNLEIMIEEEQADIQFDTLPTLYGDETQLLQLFQNLIQNGIKFQKEHKPEIFISATKKEKEWLFSVSDNGIGIPKEYAEQIFVIFQRLHTQEKYTGAGMGLAICKRIVERHGGSIWVESHEGKGTTFFFTIPENNSL